MLRVFLVVALLFPVLNPSPAHAFLFFLLAAQQDHKPKAPPVEGQGVPLNVHVPIKPEGLPLPYLIEPNPRAMATLDAPLVLAQASPNLNDVMQRLEALERENQRLRRELDDTKNAPRSGLPGAALPRQTRHGIWVHIHDWNAEGIADAGKQTNTYVYTPQEFPATIGYTAPNNLRTFRFEGWFRVKTAGTYQVGGRIDCGEFGHPCAFSIRLDGTEVLREVLTSTNLVRYAERYLEPGDYRIEYVWGLTRNNYLNYRPHTARFQAVVRTPEDMNFRGFAEDELLVPDRQDVPIGPTLNFGR